MRKILGEVAEKMPDIPGRQLLKDWGVPKNWRRMFLFWEVSVSGWLIDIGLLSLMVHLGVPVFIAACLSPLPALFWSFTMSTYKIYFREKGFSRTKFGLFLTFNLTMLLMTAWIISWGARLGFVPAVVKCCVSPVSFLMNFFFTKRLLKPKTV